MSGTRKAHATGSPAVDLLRTLRDASVKATPDFATPWVEVMSTMGSQMMSFTAERIQKDVDTQTALLHARTFAEIQHIQAQFFQQAMEDYIAETAKMLEMGRRFVPGASSDEQA